MTEQDIKNTQGRLERFRDFITSRRYWKTDANLGLERGSLTHNDIRFLYGLSDVPEKKPPLGVIPKHIWDKKRKHEIKDAIDRYIEAGYIIPLEWIDEYNELCGKELKELKIPEKKLVWDKGLYFWRR